MSDRYDDLISDALGEFHAVEAVSGSPVSGVAAVHATVAHRRKVRITTFSVLGALLIAAPIAAFAANPRGNNSPPLPGDSASPTVSSTPVPTGPDGRITVEQLTAKAVALPAFWAECPAGQFKLGTSPGADGEIGRWVTKVVHANLDGDSSLETAALVYCTAGQLPVTMVVAFDRDGQGAITLLGVVAQGVLWDVSANPAGGVTVDISDIGACCSVPKSAELHQERVYGWTGGSFNQIGGPPTFVPHSSKIDLELKQQSANWGAEFQKDVGGSKVPYRRATVKLTVTNLSTEASGQWMIYPIDQSSAVSGVGERQSPLQPGGMVEITIVVDFDVSSMNVTPSFPARVYELGSPSIGGDRNEDNNLVLVPFPA